MEAFKYHKTSASETEHCTSLRDEVKSTQVSMKGHGLGGIVTSYYCMYFRIFSSSASSTQLATFS